MKKYTDEWLMENYATEESISKMQEAFAKNIAECTTGTFVTVTTFFWVEFLLPVLLQYKFSVETFPIWDHVQITITK